MNTKPDGIDLEHDLVQWIVNEAVRAGMETPLREPILAAVEGATDREVESVGDASTQSEAAEPDGGRRTTKAIRGLTAFLVTVVIMYVFLKRSTSRDQP